MKKILIMILCYFTLFITTLCQVNTNKINSIMINGENVSLNILPSRDNKFYIKQTSDKKNIIIKRKLEGDALIFNLINKKTSFLISSTISFDIFIPKDKKFKYFFNSKDSSYEIKKINGDISIISEDGSISIEDVKGNISIFNKNKIVSLSNIIGNIKVQARNSQIFTDKTKGILDISTTHKKIVVTEADTIKNLSTSDASIFASFNKVLDKGKIVTSNHNIRIKIPKKINFNFAYFGDLIKVDNPFKGNSSKKTLILGTSNGNIEVDKKD